ncbi:DNA polymerase II large subunit [Candidatus Woesearchaeota archaeon]|nr:DNA polymerase II large subunit [Candidatus Woesearchaeota archaeon]
MSIAMSAGMRNYLDKMNQRVNEEYKIAKIARKKGFDPQTDIEMPLARNMAERVEGLISMVSPEIIGSGVSKRLAALEEKFGKLDWRVALTIALEIAQEKFYKFETPLKGMETGIRVGLAYLTLGVVSSPIEGFVELKLKKRMDGKEYFCLMYSGPIRSAGGTGAAVSVIVADYVRKKMGYGSYDATEDEIKRMCTEIYDYHEGVTNLQYLPKEEEIAFMVRHLPVQIDGDPSETMEVSNYKDLPRIETNRVRNGPCLVIGECLAQKAPKLLKQLNSWGADFGLTDWEFLKEFVHLQQSLKAKGKTKQESKGIQPVYTYIEDLVAGRPVLAHPLAVGGFRLRYGRTRVNGFSAASIHPATMCILDGFIATGTQLKVERPGKAATITVCDSVEGPIVKLANGSVVRLDSEESARKLNNEVVEILFMGDILFNYGDFFTRAHVLVPAGYCEEWWVQEVEKAIVTLFGSLDTIKASEISGVDEETLRAVLKNPWSEICGRDAVQVSRKLNVPLHPAYTYYWKTISREQFFMLLQWLEKMKIVREEEITKIVVPYEEPAKRVLELIGVPHIAVGREYVVIGKDDAYALLGVLNVESGSQIAAIASILREKTPGDVLDLLNTVSSVALRDKAGTFIGARMGRPEKAKMRELTGSPHVLFPVGDEGGRMRCFQSAMEAHKITAEFPLYECRKCKKETIFGICESCGEKTEKRYFCNLCGLIEEGECKKHGKAASFRKKDIDINNYFGLAVKKLNLNAYPDLIKGVRGTSNKDHTPENLMKGILRAKHEVYVNKDGTVRYDMTQLPITHFRPCEIGTSVEKLKSLGYEKDVYGAELLDAGQVVEIKPQDIILPSCRESFDDGADKVLFNVACFVDDMLGRMYGVEPHYNLRSGEDLAGQIVVALAPHISAGIAGRIIGFSKTQGLFAHPMFHAACRRDCDGDELSVALLLDVLLNFSRSFIPNNRGATQDAPLVLTSDLNPSEVDDMVFDVDVAWKYPLEFYEACLEMKDPWAVDIERLRGRLNTERQYEGMGFTHNTTDLNKGFTCSAYKTLPSMEEKLKGQTRLAEKIRAVDERDVARLVIEKHFLKDIKGNLRKFSTQQFRCGKCNEKFRRPPLAGKCLKCGGKLLFTVSEGSIVKYLEPAISLAEKYQVPAYVLQNLELTKRRVEGVFGKDKEVQQGLGRWFTA